MSHTHIHTLRNTQFTGSVVLLLPEVYEITLNIWGGKHIVMLTTNAQNPEHEQTLKQAFQNCKPVVSHTTSFQFPKFLAHSVEVSSSMCVLTLRYESYAISNSFLCRWHRLTSL